MGPKTQHSHIYQNLKRPEFDSRSRRFFLFFQYLGQLLLVPYKTMEFEFLETKNKKQMPFWQKKTKKRLPRPRFEHPFV